MDLFIEKPQSHFVVGEAMAHLFNAGDSITDMVRSVDYYKRRAYELQQGGAMLNASFCAGVAAGLRGIALKGSVSDESASRAPINADDRYWPTAAAMGEPFAKTCAWIRYHAGVSSRPC